MVRFICMTLAAALALASCSSSARTMSARGFEADIVLRTRTIDNAELLSLQDGILIAATDSLWIVREREERSQNSYRLPTPDSSVLFVAATGRIRSS